MNDAVDRTRRAEREPQAPVAGKALLRREVVHVEGGRVDAHAARRRRPVDDHERLAAVGSMDRHHHPGRGLVVRIRVDVAFDVVGELRTFSGLGLADLRWLEMRGRSGDRRELRGELADHQVRALPLDETEDCGIPEQRRAAVADQHLVVVGEREQLGQTAPDPVHDRADAVLAVARAEKAGRGVGERGDRRVRHLRRTGAESPVARAQCGRDLDHRGPGRRVLTESR